MRFRRVPTQTTGDPDGVSESIREERGPQYLLAFLAIGLFILVAGTALLDTSRLVPLGATAFMLGAGSMVAGGLIGLLFGVPKVIGTVAAPETADPAPPTKRIGYVANTNLERVSDWLTAIIIGVTLTQLGEIPSLVQRFVDYVRGPFGDTVTPTMVLGATLLFGGGGFIFGFLWSRLYMGPAFLVADRKAVQAMGGDQTLLG